MLESLQAVGSVATAIAVWAAGIWAFYNFGLRRIREALISLEIIPHSMAKVEQDYRAHVSLKALNRGSTKVKMERAFISFGYLSSEIQVDLGGIVRLLPREDPEIFEVFQGHTYLEPGEMYLEDCAFLCNTHSLLQVDLRFYGDRGDQVWKASCIIYPDERDQLSLERYARPAKMGRRNKSP